MKGLVEARVVSGVVLALGMALLLPLALSLLYRDGSLASFLLPAVAMALVGGLGLRMTTSLFRTPRYVSNRDVYVSVAYFDGYELQPWPEPQRYTRFEEGDGGGMYRFVSLDEGCTADLTMDSDGLVVHYPRLFKRVFTLAATSQKPFGAKCREQPVHTLGTWRS